MSQFTIVDLNGETKTYPEMIRGDRLLITNTDEIPMVEIEDLGKKRFKVTLLAPFMTMDDDMAAWLVEKSKGQAQGAVVSIKDTQEE